MHCPPCPPHPRSNSWSSLATRGGKGGYRATLIGRPAHRAGVSAPPIPPLAPPSAPPPPLPPGLGAPPLAALLPVLSLLTQFHHSLVVDIFAVLPSLLHALPLPPPNLRLSSPPPQTCSPAIQLRIDDDIAAFHLPPTQ